MIERVHLIFKTHLDVGFADLARNVVANYFQHYIPQALNMAEELAAIVLGLYGEGKLDGILGMGGMGGASVASGAPARLRFSIGWATCWRRRTCVC